MMAARRVLWGLIVSGSLLLGAGHSPAAAESRDDVQLECAGTYSKPGDVSLLAVPQKGIFMRLRGDRVDIKGARGFDDASYVVKKSDEHGIQFVHETNSALSGYINRLNGDFQLFQKKDDRYVQITKGTCRKAQPIF
jgi:hypothetical protein